MKTTLREYQVWAGDDSLTLATTENANRLREKGLLEGEAELLYQFHAATAEEASAIHHLRMGWAPYKPEGEAAPCRHCNATIYPESFGDCWRCGSQDGA